MNLALQEKYLIGIEVVERLHKPRQINGRPMADGWQIGGRWQGLTCHMVRYWNIVAEWSWGDWWHTRGLMAYFNQKVTYNCL